MRCVWLPLVVGVISVASGCARRPAPAPADRFTGQDRTVIAVALGREGSKPDLRPGYLAVTVGPDSLPIGLPPEMDTAGVPASAISDYRRRNADTVRLDELTARLLGLTLVAVDSVVEAAGPGAVRYPDIFRVSRPGYSDDGVWALVEIGLGCGLLCGMSSLELLERADGGWRSVRSLRGLVY